MIRPSTKIYRTKILEGISIPAIIHNRTYFFVDLPVYEDGRVECWDFKDLNHFKSKVNEGWIVLNIPDGESISIHGLGEWPLTNGNWTFNSRTFIDYVLSLIKEMNPAMANIYQHTEKKVNGIIIGESGKGTAYKDIPKAERWLTPERVRADNVNLFYKSGNEYWLVSVNVFADTSICLARLENPVDLTFTDFEKLIADKDILTTPPVNARVNIYGLGSFNIKAPFYTAAIDQKFLEIKDVLRKLKGVPTSIQICREAYETYIANPDNERKALLKIAYENVPDHQKRYVGDMDTKDFLVRRIIYGE